MENDHAAPVEATGTDTEPTAYISPAADFLLLAVLTAVVALAGAAIMFP